MTCSDVSRRLPEILDEGVSQGLREQMQLHLSACQSCSDKWNLLTKTWRQLGNYPIPDLTDRFDDSVMNALRFAGTEPSGEKLRKAVLGEIFRYKLPLALAAIAAVAALLGVCLLLGNSTAEATSPDLEIVRNLDFYEDLELLENLELLSDYEVINSFD